MNNILPPIPEEILNAQALSRSYQEGVGADALRVDVLHQIYLQVHAGESVAIVGASGSGKSTLLHLLGGLDTPTSGGVSLMGQRLDELDAEEQGIWRNQHLGFVYQFHHLLPEFSALENVAMPLLIRRMNKIQALEAAEAKLHDVGLEHRIDHRPAELSGGERQRVALARALVTKPSCILADEPTGNLDESNANLMFNLLVSHTQSDKSALILVTHDSSLAQRCSRQLKLQQGKLS